MSSKELYIMNGGNVVYIHKDGFGDIYSATLAEEAEWSHEVIDRALATIDNEINAVSFKAAIDNLLFHSYPDLHTLLEQKLDGATPTRQIHFATALWNVSKDEKSFEVINQNLTHHRTECLDNAFMALGDFKDNVAAQKFIIECLEGTDDVLASKAHITLQIWAYSGLPILRENGLLEMLRFENKNSANFTSAIQKLKLLLSKH